MENSKKKILVILAVIFIVGGILFMLKDSIFGGGVFVSDGMPEANDVTSEITANMFVSQDFKCKVDSINNVAIVFNKNYEYEDDDTNIPTITIELLDGEKVLISKTLSVNRIEAQHRTFVYPDDIISDANCKVLTLKITNNSNANTGCSLMIQNNSKNSFSFGDMKVNGTICFEINSVK